MTKITRSVHGPDAGGKPIRILFVGCYSLPREKRTKEWLFQPDCDMDTAEYIYKGGRRLHAVSMGE